MESQQIRTPRRARQSSEAAPMSLPVVRHGRHCSRDSSPVHQTSDLTIWSDNSAPPEPSSPMVLDDMALTQSSLPGSSPCTPRPVPTQHAVAATLDFWKGFHTRDSWYGLSQFLSQWCAPTDDSFAGGAITDSQHAIRPSGRSSGRMASTWPSCADRLAVSSERP